MTTIPAEINSLSPSEHQVQMRRAVIASTVGTEPPRAVSSQAAMNCWRTCTTDEGTDDGLMGTSWSAGPRPKPAAHFRRHRASEKRRNRLVIMQSA